MILLVCRYQAAINGEVIGNFHSYHGSTFNALGIQGVGVDTLTLKYVDVADNGWISLMEVSYIDTRLLHAVFGTVYRFGGFHKY